MFDFIVWWALITWVAHQIEDNNGESQHKYADETDQILLTSCIVIAINFVAEKEKTRSQ